jgi:integrase
MDVRTGVTVETSARLLWESYALNGRKSANRLGSAFDNLRRHLGPGAEAEIRARVHDYPAARIAEGVKPATVRQELGFLRRAFRLALDRELVERPLRVPTIRVQNARQGFSEPEEHERILSHLPEHARSLAQFAYLTGWRRREIMALRWDQVDMERCVNRIEGTETGVLPVFRPLGSQKEQPVLVRDKVSAAPEFGRRPVPQTAVGPVVVVLHPPRIQHVPGHRRGSVRFPPARLRSSLRMPQASDVRRRRISDAPKRRAPLWGGAPRAPSIVGRVSSSCADGA